MHDRPRYSKTLRSRPNNWRKSGRMKLNVRRKKIIWCITEQKFQASQLALQEKSQAPADALFTNGARPCRTVPPSQLALGA